MESMCWVERRPSSLNMPQRGDCFSVDTRCWAHRALSTVKPAQVSTHSHPLYFRWITPCSVYTLFWFNSSTFFSPLKGLWLTGLSTCSLFLGKYWPTSNVAKIRQILAGAGCSFFVLFWVFFFCLLTLRYLVKVIQKDWVLLGVLFWEVLDRVSWIPIVNTRLPSTPVQNDAHNLLILCPSI